MATDPAPMPACDHLSLCFEELIDAVRDVGHGVTTEQFATALGLPMEAVASLLRDLEAAGWIRKVPDSNGGTFVPLTKGVREFHPAMVPELRRIALAAHHVREAFGGLAGDNKRGWDDLDRAMDGLDHALDAQA